MRKFDLIAIALIALTPVTIVSAAYAKWGGGAAYAEPMERDYLMARVVGYHCEGASGPLLASQEDELPPCASIEPLPQTWAVPLTLESE